MINKQGVTLVALTVTVIILLILAGVIAISTYSTINFARLSSWVNEILYIQDATEETLSSTTLLPYTTDKVTIDLSDLSSEQINIQFSGETITDNGVELNVLDLGALKITKTAYGNLETATDVYAYSTVSGKVYYVQGVEIDGVIYYTFTDNLRDRFNLAPVNNTLSSIVFVPSVVDYTNEAVSVIVKIPNTFTSISITTSNADITVGTQTLVDSMYEYVINSNNITGNYDITVSYNNGTQSNTTTYSVNSYDATKPTIVAIEEENFVKINNIMCLTKISATDPSGIKYLKYAPGIIRETDAKNYFAANGNNVVGGKINVAGQTGEYTIYAEDRAGNFTILTFDRADYISLSWVKDGFTVKNDLQTLNIGDIVHYDETVGGTRTGLTATEWKVLGADEDGNLLLMSTTNVVESYRLGYEDSVTGTSRLIDSQNDWINSVTELDGLCEPYGYGNGVVGKARSITLEDIDKVTGYDKTTYAKGTLYQYGNEVTYSYNGTEYPSYTSAVASSTLTLAHSNGFHYYDGSKVNVANDLTEKSSGTIVTLKSDNYHYAAPKLITDNVKANSMIFGDNNYWLASPYVYTYTNCASFGLRLVESGKVIYQALWYSNRHCLYYSSGIRPVVTLSSDIVFKGNSTDGWRY